MVIQVAFVSSCCTISLMIFYFLYIYAFVIYGLLVLRLCYYSTIIITQYQNLVALYTTTRSCRNLVSHISSFVASKAATYSTFVVKSTIQLGFMLFQLMAPSYCEDIFGSRLTLFSISYRMHKHRIFYSSRTFQTMLDNSQVFWSWIGLKSDVYANSVSDIRPNV